MMMMMMIAQVPCNDKAYTWLLAWISREAAAKSQHLSLRRGAQV